MSAARSFRGAAAWAAIGSILFSTAGCAGSRLREMEERQKQIVKRLDEVQATLQGLEKRVAVRQGLGAASAAETGKVTVAVLLADPLTYSGRLVQVEAVMGGPVDRERSFFTVLNKPRDPLSNLGVYFDPEELASKRDVYLSDPGDWLVIEGQLAADKEPAGLKGYSGYALKAKTVRKLKK